MGLKTWIKSRSNQLLRPHGFQIFPTGNLYEWQRTEIEDPVWNKSPLPADATAYLKPDNPKLVSLRARYGAFNPDVTTPAVWTDEHIAADHISYFRGDNPWVWQVRGKNSNVLAYAVSYYYLKAMDKLGLFDKLSEDESFGNFLFMIAGRKVSRDLLDSIAEIYFLDRHLGLGSRKEGLRVLDIGAGYGRLAHRMTSTLDCVESYFCTDAVAASTFVSEYYLRFRGAVKAAVIPLDEIEARLAQNPIDLAINIHSFSECRMQAVEWWIRLLSTNGVKNLMLVPNWSAGRGDRILTNDGQDILPVLQRYGYKSVVCEPKYLDPIVQEFGLYPSWHHLFQLQV